MNRLDKYNKIINKLRENEHGNGNWDMILLEEDNNLDRAIEIVSLCLENQIEETESDEQQFYKSCLNELREII